MCGGVVGWLGEPGGTLAAPTPGFQAPLLRSEILPRPRSSSPEVRKDLVGAFRRPRRGEDVRRYHAKAPQMIAGIIVWCAYLGGCLVGGLGTYLEIG